jgi:hypothetical protein
MKKIVILSMMILFIHNVESQTASSCLPPALLQASYDRDVKHLALKRINELNSPYKDSIVIPLNSQDTIWQGLAAIYNLTTIPARDSVFDNYCIHQEISYFVVNSIYVGVDPSFSWTTQWQSLNTITGITAMDNLLATYGFTVTAYSTFGGHYATLTTTQNINVKPLCDSLETFGGVLYSEPNYFAGDGNQIIYNKNVNGRFYDFIVGYGDCNAGCIAKHIFKFKVHDDCSVDYLGITDITSSTYSLPPPVNCFLTSGIQDKTDIGFKIYPNPADNYLSVEKTNDFYSNFTIRNLYGQTVQTGILSEKTSISIESLTSGLYLIRFYSPSNKEYINYKFIKN